MTSVPRLIDKVLQVLIQLLTNAVMALVSTMLRCDEMQGYLVGEPVPVEGLIAMLGERPVSVGTD